MKTKAISYTRLSTAIQIRGRSLKRQTESPEVLAFIKNHNLEIINQISDSAIKKAQKWMDDCQVYLRDFNNRKTIRNLMPSIYDRIILSHSAAVDMIKTEIDCMMIGGKEIRVWLIKNTKTGVYTIE